VKIEPVDMGESFLLSGLDRRRTGDEAKGCFASSLSRGYPRSGGSPDHRGEQRLVLRKGIEGAIVKKATLFEKVEHPKSDHRAEDSNVLLLRHLCLVEYKVPGGVLGENSIEGGDVIVNVQVEGATKSLNDRNCSGFSIGYALVSSEVPVEIQQRINEDSQHLETELVPPGKQISQRYWQREYILANGYKGDHVVDEMCRALRCSAGNARRAQSPTFARQG
jgi:hypothetical protein